LRALRDLCGKRFFPPITISGLQPPPTFDPGNSQPLGFNSAILFRLRHWLRRKWQGPSFTLIQRDHYTNTRLFPYSIAPRSAEQKA
jgi:hypothetical protein